MANTTWTCTRLHERKRKSKRERKRVTWEEWKKAEDEEKMIKCYGQCGKREEGEEKEAVGRAEY